MQTRASLIGWDESPLIFLLVKLFSSWEINCICMIQLRRRPAGKRRREGDVIYSRAECWQKEMGREVWIGLLVRVRCLKHKANESWPEHGTCKAMWWFGLWCSTTVQTRAMEDKQKDFSENNLDVSGLRRGEWGQRETNVLCMSLQSRASQKDQNWCCSCAWLQNND